MRQSARLLQRPLCAVFNYRAHKESLCRNSVFPVTESRPVASETPWPALRPPQAITLITSISPFRLRLFDLTGVRQRPVILKNRRNLRPWNLDHDAGGQFNLVRDLSPVLFGSPLIYGANASNQ
jgi:hypothetical protein